MIRMIQDVPTKHLRERTFSYDPNNDNDKRLLGLIYQIISDNQPECFNCENYYLDGSFCGYQASMCRIYGCIEAYDNPHNDADGSKCKDYQRK